MIFFANAPLAQTTVPSTSHPTSASGGGSLPFYQNPIFLPIILIGVFILFSSRNRKNADRKVQDMLSNLKKGDRVQTIGGILGTVVEARDNEVVLKVDETNNTKMRFSRKAIHVVLQDDVEKKPS